MMFPFSHRHALRHAGSLPSIKTESTTPGCGNGENLPRTQTDPAGCCSVEPLGAHCLVTVIIPVYNVRPYLEECLDSVIHQTWSNLEILVIDDGSTDGSGEICDRYQQKDPRIRVFHQENGGLSAARNTGLDNMTGDVVAFLDSDDFFQPDMIRRMVQILREKNVDIAACGVDSIFDLRSVEGSPEQPSAISSTDKSRRGRNKGRKTDRRKNAAPADTIYLPDEGYYSKQAYLESILSPGKIDFTVWNKVYRSFLFREIRFPAGHVYEDIDTSYRVADLANTFYAIPDLLIRNRRRTGSISRTITPKNLRDRQMAYQHFEEYILSRIPFEFDHSLLTLFRQRYMNMLFSTWGFLCLGPNCSDTDYRRQIRQELLHRQKEIPVSDMTGHLRFFFIRFFPDAYSLLFLLNMRIRHREYLARPCSRETGTEK